MIIPDLHRCFCVPCALSWLIFRQSRIQSPALRRSPTPPAIKALTQLVWYNERKREGDVGSWGDLSQIASGRLETSRPTTLQRAQKPADAFAELKALDADDSLEIADSIGSFVGAKRWPFRGVV